MSLPKPPLSLETLASLLPGSRLAGDGQVQVTDLTHPRMIASPDQMALVLDAGALQGLQERPGTVHAAVVAEGLVVPDGLFKGYISVERPRLALATLLSIFEKPLHAPVGVHPSAIIDASATIHPSASVGAFTVVGAHARIGSETLLLPHVTVGASACVGERCVIHPGARIGERVILGNRVIIHHNASIGADGFSYVTPEIGSVESARASGGKVTAKNDKIFKIPSIGTVILEDDVEIGACATVDRANVGATLIKRGSKIDNLVMIAHNNVVGENCMLVSQVGVAGSCEIGDRVVMAGQVGLGDHLKVGDDAVILAKSGVMRDVAPQEVVGGIPAMPRREALQSVMYIGRLRELFREVKALQKRVAELEAARKNESDSETAVAALAGEA